MEDFPIFKAAGYLVASLMFLTLAVNTMENKNSASILSIMFSSGLWLATFL